MGAAMIASRRRRRRRCGSVGCGTGPGGRIIAADVQDAIASGATARAAAAPSVSAPAAAATAAPAAVAAGVPPRAGYVDVPHTAMRRVIAHRLTVSKQTVPHYTLTSEINLDALLALRTSLNEGLAADGKLSVNDFIIKASALAMHRVPEMNSSWLDGVIRAYEYVDVGVAVALPEGLITPIVKDADKKGLASISAAVKALVEKARSKKLLPEEYQGGTFTVSNLGMFGVRQFSAIINPPQAGILAIGAAERRVVPETKPGAELPYKQAVIVSTTLSCDHRVVDGAVGAQWLSAFKGYLEAPHTMLL
jgi:pyruvate dehydrogenase E2 component (dihydrolipoamide acetyltransferase)